jgi:hypothetical protein
MKTLKFYKEDSGSWYVDLDWKGAKAELLMVAGADTMLDILAGNKASVELDVDLHAFTNSTMLTLRHKGETEGGGHYFVKEHNGQQLNLEVWLCDVTNFVFGYIPEKIFFRLRRPVQGGDA